jgi:MFS family permease
MLYGSGVDKEFIGILFSVYLIVVLFSDYPTGGFADIFGRRNIHSVGLCLEGISLIIMSLFYNSLALLSAFILSVVGIAMMSGSLSAWFVDEAKRIFGDQDSIKQYMEKYFSLSYSLNSALGLVGGLTASLISLYGLKYPVLIGGILFIVLAIFIIFLTN